MESLSLFFYILVFPSALPGLLYLSHPQLDFTPIKRGAAADVVDEFFFTLSTDQIVVPAFIIQKIYISMCLEATQLYLVVICHRVYISRPFGTVPSC